MGKVDLSMFIKDMNKKRKEKRATEIAERVKMDPTHKKILWVVFVIFVIYSFTLIFPFFWLLFNSVKTKQEFFFQPWAWPKAISGGNYLEIFRVFDLGTMFFNSVTLCLFCPATNIFITCCAAYAVSKFKFRGREVIYFVAIMVMFIPTTGSLAVLYKMMFDTHLIDTLPGMILMSTGGFGFNFLLLYGFFKNIPWSYAEAAYMDGASNWKVFTRIMIPQVMPAITAILIMSIIGTWNDYLGPYLFYNSHLTIATGLKYLSDNIKAGAYVLDYPKLFAAIIITTMPIIILFIACQKFIVKLNMGGALKG